MTVGRTLAGSSVFLEDDANMVGERRARGRESSEAELKGTVVYLKSSHWNSRHWDRVPGKKGREDLQGGLAFMVHLRPPA